MFKNIKLTINTLRRFIRLLRDNISITVNEDNIMLNIKKNIIVNVDGNIVTYTKDGYIISSAKKTFINPVLKEEVSNLITGDSNCKELNHKLDEYTREHIKEVREPQECKRIKQCDIEH